MAAKTSQLQIRVTEEQKAALKRLAEAAKMSVSGYVLAQALPSGHERLARALARLALPGAGEAAFTDISALIAETDPAEIGDVLGSHALEGLGPLVQNQLAGLVEQAVNAVGLEPPAWVEQVPRLERPHFGWPLSSLRPHQIRVTPVAFKRRGIFFDPASRPAFQPARARARRGPSEPSQALRRLEILDLALAEAELKVEFYFLGGAVLIQVFHGRPPTAHVRALFRPISELSDIQTALAAREGWPAGWMQQAVRDQLSDPRARGWLELGNLAAFVPPLEYVLALSVARLRLGSSGGAVEDLRYVLRALDLRSADEALEVVVRYFTPRQLPHEAWATLDTLLAA